MAYYWKLAVLPSSSSRHNRPPVVVLPLSAVVRPSNRPSSSSYLIMFTITECPFCHKELPKTNRYRHFPHCLRADAKLPCDECSKLVCVRHYPRHRMSCGSKRIECKVCGKAISKSNMKRHSKNMHDVKENPPTACLKVAAPAATPTERNPPMA